MLLPPAAATRIKIKGEREGGGVGGGEWGGQHDMMFLELTGLCSHVG